MFVYIVECSDGAYYVGHTADLADRERVHNEGRGARFTAAPPPVTLVYAEQWHTLSAAVRREGLSDRTVTHSFALFRTDTHPFGPIRTLTSPS